MKHQMGVHPQLWDLYNELFEELVSGGMSVGEAYRQLNTIFDWALNEASRKILRPREDEFADNETARQKAADKNEDLAATWLAARERNDGSHLFLERLIGLRGNELG